MPGVKLIQTTRTYMKSTQTNCNKVLPESKHLTLIERQQIDMKGYIPRDNPTYIKVAQTLVLANAAPDHGLSTVASGTNVVTGIKIGLKKEDLASFEVSSTIYDF